MTYRTLEIFVAVAECGSMSAAARKLHISQSAVSQVVVEMEREYGVLLFERYAHTLHLTQVGSILLSYARQSLLLAEETESFLMSLNRRARLRVGASVTIGSSLLCPLLEKLREAMEAIDFEVAVSNTHEIEAMILGYELDIALVEGKVSHADLVTETVAEDRLQLVCGKGHPFYGRAEVRPEELNGQAFILREEGSGTRAQLERELERHKLDFKVSWVCHNTDVIQKAVIHNFGISALSPRVFRENAEKGLLWPFEVHSLKLERRFTLIYHKDKYPSEAFERFKQLCLHLDDVEDLRED